jgi:hypothetical protein
MKLYKASSQKKKKKKWAREEVSFLCFQSFISGIKKKIVVGAYIRIGCMIQVSTSHVMGWIRV